MKKLRLQSRVIPRYNFRYGLNWEKEVVKSPEYKCHMGERGQSCYLWTPESGPDGA